MPTTDFKDLAPVDYSAEYLTKDDDGLLNRQYVKRRRALREEGLPYRRANSRRLIERHKRRSKYRPYLKMA